MSVVCVGVVGFGYWGPNLVRNLFKAESCRVMVIADSDPQRLRVAAGMYPSVEMVSDANAVLDRQDIDAVLIASPTATHFPLAKRALLRGKHVLVEKPLAQTAREAETLVELARRGGLTLMVDHTFIYSGAVRKIREAMRLGELGEIWYLDSVRINLGLFRTDVSVLEDLAPHDLSIQLYALDLDATSVSAIGIAPVGYGGQVQPSLVYLTLRLPNEAIAHFTFSWLSPLKIRRMLIGGSKKMLMYDHLEPDHQVKIYDKGVDLVTESEQRRLLAERRTGDLYAPKVDQTEPLERMCSHFLDCVQNGRTPDSDGEAGLKVVRLIEVAQRSLKSGGKVLSV